MTVPATSPSRRGASPAPGRHSSPPSPSLDLLDEIQTGRILKVSRRTLQGWRTKGEGPPFVDLGRRVRYRRADLIAFIEARLRRSTSDPGPGAA